MFQHFIILYSDYKTGKRLAYHQADYTVSGLYNVLEIMEMLKKDFPHLSFGFHHLQTANHSWKSIIDYDRFFSDVVPIDNIDIFKDFISEDLCISALDVANLITSKVKCTHLKLQKLLYLFYCEYIKKYKDRPFKEDFYAWPYGPVIKEVYEKYKIYGREILEQEDDNIQIDKEKSFILSVSSRFTKTPMHHKVVDVLKEVIEEYGELDAFTLVEITHMENGPWDKIFNEGAGKDRVIPADIIKEHCFLH
ncbi:Panacea domain-containing protein [Sutcliffiella horikoshii]|uniref:Panacea domain-containing protein n=1 Tax=Sutcliffiella horikoshii TaxID=79883 RepID=UPI003CFA9D2F